MPRLLTIAGLALVVAGPLAAQPPAGAGAKDAFVARCRLETVAAYPNARAQVDAICASRWQEILAAGPIAETLLSLAPAPGQPFNPAAIRARAASMRGFDVTANRPPAGAGVTVGWHRAGEPIPFNLEDALRARGATLAMIACLSYGAGEGARVWRVSAAGKAPFALTVSFRNAAVASQSSAFTATADYSGRAPTLAALRRDGDDWNASCPA